MSTLHLTPSGDPQSPIGWCNEREDCGRREGGGGSQGRTDGGGRGEEREGEREEGGREVEKEGGREGEREGKQSYSSKECFLDQINIIKHCYVKQRNT